jgi:hypothetical protein
VKLLVRPFSSYFRLLVGLSRRETRRGGPAGDSNVPERHRLNPSLGEWVRKQRHDYSLKCGGDQSAMIAKHEAKLNTLGFSWVERKSSAGSNNKNNNNNVIFPDKVITKNLPMNSKEPALPSLLKSEVTTPPGVAVITKEKPHLQQQVSRREKLDTSLPISQRAMI